MLLRRSFRTIRLPALGCFVTVRTEGASQGQLQNQQFAAKTYESRAHLEEYVRKDLWQSILRYPFVYIPFSLITRYPQLPASSKDQVKDAVAFRCLTNAKEEQLRQAYDILLPSRTSLKKINANEFDVGRLMFTEHFTVQSDALKKTLKEGGDRRLKYLAVLNHFRLNNSTTELVREISEKQLQWDKTGLALALYVQLLIKNNLPFRFLIPKLIARLDDATLPLPDKLNIATALISLPRFYKSFPQEFIEKLLRVIKGEVSRLGNYELLQVVRFVYEYRSQESESLCKALLEELQSIGSNLQADRVPFFLPLIIKTLKYAGALKAEVEATVISLIDRTPHCSTLFEGISLRHYHTLIFLWQQSSSPSLLGRLKAHIFAGFRFYQQSDEQVELEEMVKFLQLTGKHWQQLSLEEKQAVKGDLLRMLERLPIDKAILYESLHILLQDGEIWKEEADRGRLVKLTRQYFDLTCARNNLDVLHVKSNIDQNITLCQLILKNKLIFLRWLPEIETISFDQINMLDLITLDKLVDYLNLLNDSKTAAVAEAVVRLEETFIHHINKKRMAFRTVLSIMQLCSKTDYQRKQLYFRMEKSVFEVLRKFSHFVPTSSDLHLIKDHMTSRSFGSKGFQEMVQQALERPDQWQDIRKKYVDKQEEYWRRVDEAKQAKGAKK